MTLPTVDFQPSLDDFFTVSARRHPEREALFVAGASWSYTLLDSEAARIELTLQSLGFEGRAANIGLLYGRSAFTYASIIAILRTGNVYVPLNSRMPWERLRRMIEDADIRLLLVDASAPPGEAVAALLQQIPELQVVLDGSGAAEAQWAALLHNTHHRRHRLFDASSAGNNRTAAVRSGTIAPQVAYILYTSGSTGIPKGIAITHAKACACIDKLHTLFETNEYDRFSQFSALTFDVSIADLFLCWKSAGALYVPAAEEVLMPLRFAASHALTVWSSVPSLANIQQKLALLRANTLPQLRFSLFAGEALPVELTRVWALAAPATRIFNLYGPTECTIFSTFYEFDRDDSTQSGVVPIGRPLPGLQHMVVSDGTQVTTEGVAGELWLAGDQLAGGYWKNPAASQSAFVRFPGDASPDMLWYRTGDLVTDHRDVGLVFRGRLDRQIKLRGFRVELQEIESALRDVTGGAQAAVVPICNSAGMCEKLVAFCDAPGLDEPSLKERLAARIPRYMIPDHITELKSFPHNDSGKVDYLALAARTREQFR